MWKRGLNSIDDVIATIALAGLFSVTIGNVILRFVFNSPIPWGEEVSLALYVWVVFVGASSAMKRNGHIGIDYFVDRMPQGLKKVAMWIRALVIYGVTVYVFIYLGYELAAQAGPKVTPVLKIDYFWIDIAVPIGGILLTYHFTRVFIKSLRNNSVERGDI